MARGASWTTSSSSDCGAASNTRKSTSTPMRRSPRPRPALAPGLASTMRSASTRASAIARRDKFTRRACGYVDDRLRRAAPLPPLPEQARKAHPRNKSDEEIRFIVEHGGFVGVTMFPPFLARGNDSTVEDYVAAIDYVIRIAGEDHVGIGTDFTQNQDDAFFEYICHDKGYGWRGTGPLGEVVKPAGLHTIGDFPNLTAAMERAGWPEAKIRKVMGANWLRLLADVWGE